MVSEHKLDWWYKTIYMEWLEIKNSRWEQSVLRECFANAIIWFTNIYVVLYFLKGFPLFKHKLRTVDLPETAVQWSEGTNNMFIVYAIWHGYVQISNTNTNSKYAIN